MSRVNTKHQCTCWTPEFVRDTTNRVTGMPGATWICKKCLRIVQENFDNNFKVTGYYVVFGGTL